MSKFNPGDRVVANRTIVARVEHYSDETGRLVLIQELDGGATNRIEGPIGSYDLELLVSEAVTQRVEDEASESEEPTEDEGPKDEFQTADSLS